MVNWDFEQELDDDAPVVVDLGEGWMKPVITLFVPVYCICKQSSFYSYQHWIAVLSTNTGVGNFLLYSYYFQLLCIQFLQFKCEVSTCPGKRRLHEAHIRRRSPLVWNASSWFNQIMLKFDTSVQKLLFPPFLTLKRRSNFYKFELGPPPCCTSEWGTYEVTVSVTVSRLKVWFLHGYLVKWTLILHPRCTHLYSTTVRNLCAMLPGSKSVLTISVFECHELLYSKISMKIL